MENKKLLAEALLDLAKSSTTTVVEAADDKELIDAASKLGMVLPSPDLAVLKTVYAEIGKVNLNGVVLNREAVEKGLPTLIGKQMNWEHLGAYNVCGYIINSSIKEDKIEIIAVVFKSLFPEEFDIVQEKFKKGTLAVSFEIWNVDPATRQSVVSELADGNVEINPIIFHGCGLLLTSAPACPKAKIYKLLAKKEIDKLFTEDLVYAQLAIAEPKCANCGTCKCDTKKEVLIVEEIKAEEIKSETALVVIPEEKVEEIVIAKKDGDACDMGEGKMGELHIDSEGKESCVIPEAHKKMHEEMNRALEIIPETKVEEIKVEAEVKLEEVAKTTPEETKVEAEVKPEVVEEVAKVEDANVITKTEVEVKVIETSPVLDVVTTEKRTTEVVVDESGKVLNTIVEEVKTVETFSYDQVLEKVAEAKLELQKIVEAKDTEIEKLKQELEVAKQPKEIVKASEEEITQADLTVGEVNTTGEDLELKRQKDNVNNFIASKHKK